MRPFALVRLEDVSGVSGTGVVAQGVEFSGGTTAMHWMVEPRSTAVYNSVSDLIATHGRGGKTQLRWLVW